VRIERFDPVTDTEKIRACHELFLAAEAVDNPEVPPASLPVFTGWVSRGWDADPREGWLVPGDEPGTWAASCRLEYPVRENRHMAHLDLVVAPAYRRRGIGTALLRHAAIRAADNGRSLMPTESREGTAGEAFAVATGATRGVIEVRRILDLADVPAGLLDTLRGRAGAASAGYSLVTFFGRAPDEYLGGVAAVINAMADAPHNPDEEPEQIDAQRLRDGDALEEIQQTRNYSVLARHDHSAEIAGMTRISVDPNRPAWGFQQLTAVRREHRGHRLGLLVKVAMMDWLAEAEPQIEHIVTGNADINGHMIAINADLGYRVLDQWPSFTFDVAKVLDTPAPLAHAQHR
jgi:GNAT superfamily N-acetyltransferase